MPEQFEISASVGRRSKGAVNKKDDVEMVQDMLRTLSMIRTQPQFDPNGTDGIISQNEQNSDTIKAIEAFQRTFMSAPDGVIGVGQRTWRELVDAVDGTDDDQGPAGGTASSTGPAVTLPANATFFFPFKQLPNLNWTESIRRFGARRSGGRRAHAACDLYFPEGTIIHAIADGRVTLGPYAFYQGTFALEIDHGSFLARYGEIKQSTFVRVGDRVTAGQPIARVGNLTGIVNSMLHLELYDKSAQGPLTVRGNLSKKTSDGVPFQRRRDLIDPTQKLNQWKNNLPS